jgi:hypothetical protein
MQYTFGYDGQYGSGWLPLKFFDNIDDIRGCGGGKSLDEMSKFFIF